MRIVKLSEVEFEDERAIDDYFDYLHEADPPGKFRITDRRIAEDGLEPGEYLIFSYNGTICRIALSASGRLDNKDEYKDTYPFYFKINLDTLQL
jgi:hypothetical protein